MATYGQKSNGKTCQETLLVSKSKLRNKLDKFQVLQSKEQVFVFSLKNVKEMSQENSFLGKNAYFYCFAFYRTKTTNGHLRTEGEGAGG